MATVTTQTLRPARGAELFLMVFALAVGIGAYLLVGLGASNAIPDDLIQHVAVLVGCALALHITLRLVAPYADPVIAPAAIFLVGLGLAMIRRLDLAYAARGLDKEFGSKQTLWLIIGVGAACAVLLFLRDHRTLRRYTYISMVLALILIVAPMLPGIGRTINGARIWIRIAGTSMQPAEFAKILLAIFFAGYLVANRDNLSLAGKRVLGLQLPRLRDFGPLLVVWGLGLAILILQRDLGTSLMFFGMFLAMLYLATERVSWVVIGLLLFVGGALAAANAFAHVGARFNVWLNAMDSQVFEQSPGGSGQLVRGLYGLASGGLFGTGLGEGRPDLVPYAESDFIVASLGEELGLVGLMAILVVYLVLVERGLRTGIGVRDGFGKLLAGGLALVIAWQCFVVVGGITRIIPLTGLTMPLVAYGGSSMLANWIVIALLLRISNIARHPHPPAAPRAERERARKDGEPTAAADPDSESSDGASTPTADPAGNENLTQRIEQLSDEEVRA